MAQAITQSRAYAVPIEISMFRYFSKGQRLCVLTFMSYESEAFQFSPSSVTIIPHEGFVTRKLNSQEGQLLRRVAEPLRGNHTIAERMVIAPHNVRLGPYPVEGIGYHVGKMLIAIHAVYLPEGTILLTFLSNWPRNILADTVDQLIEMGCQRFTTGLFF